MICLMMYLYYESTGEMLICDECIFKDKCRNKKSGVKVETNIFTEVEEHENCTVQILKNNVTGEVSVGWWENEKEEE